MSGSERIPCNIAYYLMRHQSEMYIILTRMNSLTLFRMGLFGAAHEWGGALSKICHKYPTMIKLGTAIPYLKEIRKIFESRGTPFEFC